MRGDVEMDDCSSVVAEDDPGTSGNGFLAAAFSGARID